MAKTSPAHRRAATTTPIRSATWLGLALGLGLGILLHERSHPGVSAAGLTLLVMLVPLTIAVMAAAVTRGPGSKKAMAVTLFFFTLAVLSLSYYL